MAKPKSYDELLSEIALAREAGDKNDELAWKAKLQSNYVVSEKQLEQELKSLIKSQAKTITESLNTFDDEVDTFFKGNCEIQPKDRIVYLRDKAKNLGLNLRDSEIRAKIWEGRKRSKGLVTMLAPDMEINAPQEVWLVEDLIMKSDTNLLIASPKVGKTTLVVDLIGKWSRGVEDSYLGKKFIGKCPPVFIVGTDMPRSRWLPLLNRFGLAERIGKDKWKLLNPIVGLFTQNESLHLDDSGLSRIGELVSKHEGCLLLIDSYSKVVAPLGVKEADASFAGPIGDLQEVVAPFGVTTIVIHHSGKQSLGSGAVMASRGSTALPAAVSQVVNLKWFNRDENRQDKRILLETEGRGMSLEAIILQTQYGFETEGNATDVIEKQKEKEKIARLQDSQAEVFEEVKDRRPQEVTSGDIKNALKIGDRSALRSLRALERKGLLISETRRTDKGRCVVFKISPTTVLTD
ncbi:MULTISPECIES: AAA family ATPase [unclassified Prochlorococcus]|jgi:hypothetical protein|uniref:AAA family ATPase n=1 Tax=unclassified Prochlorococcus TaxID=2627481 RepID=UPI00097CCC7C|nr:MULTISPECIES: AAA family ATPase [unclassified Prochlorococcus]AQL31317.1 hypothetical protein BSR22_09050 [Prochlorococcus sp. RS50]AQL31742.1 hypothetical protein BS620_01620 [Prochlorococcus sp. RS01]AQL34694.1 hypothetical protein BS621_07940 [Prochlorococcus sp. RS04]|tara:strand:- start:95 stop:1483 length:1389 start_codon:yes stop_codon:yes gene_type:complete